MEDDMSGNAEFLYDSGSKGMKLKEGYPGSFTLRFPSGKELTPENLAGSFRLLNLKGSFTGLEGLVGAGDNRPSVNRWNIGDVDWGKSSNEETEGHKLEVYDLADDNGNKFIAFVWDQGWSGCCPHSSTCLAKKRTDENIPVGLTDSERDRIGLYLTKEEVKKKANAAGGVEGGAAGKVSNKRKMEDEELDVKRKREV
jgi:hypothetical protein